MRKGKTLDRLNDMPASKAVITNVVPAVAAMLMAFVYNLVDTFFISQTNDAYQIAAVSLASPVVHIFVAVGSVFGVGATSVISRALGRRDKWYACKVSSFCIWGCVAAGIILFAFFWVFMDQILALTGASQDTWALVRSYLSIVVFCGPLVLVGNCCVHILRGEGQATKAITGMLIGNTVNVILDPILILALDWGIVGAAAATVIGNIVAAGYYILYFLQGKSMLRIHIKNVTVRSGVCKSVFAIGLPVALGSILLGVSQVILNSRTAAYGDTAVAGMSIAMQVAMIPGIVSIGLGQGIQPLLGYCVGAKIWRRYKKIMWFSSGFALILGVLLTAGCYLCMEQMIRLFLVDITAFDYGVKFGKILLTASALFGVFYVFTNALQAMGAAIPCLIINLSRQGLIYIPALFILSTSFGLDGLVWAQPITNILSVILAIVLHLIVWRKIAD